MTTDAPALDDLRRLLQEPGSDPCALAAALAEARAHADLDALTRQDLDRLELAFLRRQAARPGAPASLRAAVDAAALAAVRLETQAAARRPDDDVAAPFDLAEQRAVYRCAHLDDDAASALAELQRRLPRAEVDDRCVEEARERYAALATEEEDLDLEQRIALLEETASVLSALAARAAAPPGGGPDPEARRAAADRARELRRLARRTMQMRHDRVLVRRLEALLTPRGARLLELTSLTLLAAVAVLLALEASFAWHPRTLQTFVVIDACICLFFIAEFAFKLALAPARLSWFLRNALTDLLPAIPAALLLFPVSVPSGGEDVVFVRALRLLRVTWFARYLNAVRPLFRLLRLLLFLVKGMDGLVRRFSPLLNRNFVFFERLAFDAGRSAPRTPRDLAFRALRREHVLLAEAGSPDALRTRAEALAGRLAHAPLHAERKRSPRPIARDVPVETAIQTLHGLQVQEVLQLLSTSDLRAIDRVVCVLSAPVVRSLPIVHHFAVHRLPAEPAARVAAFAHRIAAYLERWRSRLVFFADLHGIVTGPQLLDRVATAMVKASQRPAVRLLLFGALFFLVRLLVGAESGPGLFLKRFVAAPLVILGSVCAVFLSIGWWLKKIAGEASEAFKLTSEARFISILDALKVRREPADAAFLARRVFGGEVEPAVAAAGIVHAMRMVQGGETTAGRPPVLPDALRNEVHQVALLQLHYMAGALLHESDVKTTEQLLANPSLENVRAEYLRLSRRERRRLRRLSLSDGSLFSGPYLWFSFITESAAVETAKRVTEYNRHCLTLAQQQLASEAELAEYRAWLQRRRHEATGRTLEKLPPPGRGLAYRTTEFCALDFLSVTPERDAHIGAVFGDEVLAVLRRDREAMVREIFGMRPVHRLPPSRRSFNFYAFYGKRLSRGRVLLLPLWFLVAFFAMLGFVARKTAATVREILRPQLAQRRRVSGRAPFAVALRKIHRMKAPGLLEAMRLRAAFDPEYCGAPATWSFGEGYAEVCDLQRDLDFLHLDARQRTELEMAHRVMRERVEEWQRIAPQLAFPAPPGGEAGRRHAERAATIAWVTDFDFVRTLHSAHVLLAQPRDVAPSGLGGLLRTAAAWLRHPVSHPIEVVLACHFPYLPLFGAARRALRRAFDAGDPELRAVVAAASTIAAGTDWQAEAAARLARVYRAHADVTRDLCAVRAVQSLTVLDVRNYRELVFELGGYADDGEDPAAARALP